MVFIPSVDATLPEPPFRQIHDAVVAAVLAGELQSGERLPTTRGLASDLGVAVNTVAAAYRALEEAGVVEGRGRAGTFVSLERDPVAASARQVALRAAEQLSDLGLTPDDARRVLGEAVDAVRRDR